MVKFTEWTPTPMRRENLHTHELGIPVDSIIAEYDAYLEEICSKCASFAIKEMKKNVKRFYRPDMSAGNKKRWRSVTGNLRAGIRRKRSLFNKKQYIAGCSSPHAHLLEYGHSLWIHGKQTEYYVPAYPFIRPAERTLQENLQQIIDGVLSTKSAIVVGGK